MSEVVVETEALTMRFGGVVAVDSVSMRLRRKELLCLIGPNGAGKTTFFRCLTGQYSPSEGRVWVDGRSVAGWPIHAIAQLGVGIKTQVPSLANGLSVYENLWLAARSKLPSAQAHERAQELIDDLALSNVAMSLTGTLAHGIRQMVEIGVALSARPWLLLLDEPAGGLTAEEAHRVAQLVLRLNESITVIVVEHDMEFVRALAQRVMVFHQGRVIADGQADAVLADEQVRRVYLGTKVR
jgi:ABC-type branched-subunit amino acid transport system ATPase component